MLTSPLVYNNKIMNLDNFIDSILFKNVNTEINSCSIRETPLVYYITAKFFSPNKHTFQMYYKNNFLIMQIKNKHNPKETLLTRMFYLLNINTRKISHIYYDDSLILKVPKIYCH